MLIDRFDKDGTQVKLGDYLLYKNGEPFKVIYNDNFLSVGIVDKDENFSFMSDWVKEDWTVTTYEELYGE